MKQSYYQALQSKSKPAPAPAHRHLLILALIILTTMGAAGCQATKPQPTTVPTTTTTIPSPVTTTVAAAEATATPPPTTTPAQALAQNLSLNLNSPYTLEQVGKPKTSSTTLWKNQEDIYTLQDKATTATLGTITIKHISVTNQPAAYLHITYQANPEILNQPDLQTQSQSQQQPLTLDFPLAAPKEQYTIIPITPDSPGASKPPAFYQSPNQSLFISSLQAYKPLSTNAFARQPNPQLTTIIENQTLHLNFPVAPQNLEEYWLIISPEQLVNPQDQNEITRLQAMDFDKTRQWSSLGNLELIPSAYQGAGPQQYWSNYGYHMGNKLLQQGTSPFSSIYAVVAAQHLLSRYPESGFFTTPFHVDWLTDQYNIEKDFYDTRLNTDAATFIANIASEYDLKEARTALKRHVTFYKSYIANYSFLYKKADRVYQLPMDYANLNPQQPTEQPVEQPTGQATNYASLSHVLAQATLLYQNYLVTNDPASKQLANQLIESISVFGKEWVKPNGDLWYAYHPINGFILDDSPQVTLNSLYQCQAIYLKANGKANKFIKEMIVAKEAYLASSAK